MREKLFFGSANAQLKVLLPVSGFGVMVVFAPNKSPINPAKSCCGFWLAAGAGTGTAVVAGMAESPGGGTS